MNTRDRPVRDKLATIATRASGIALVSACAIFLVYDVVSSGRGMERDGAAIGDMVARNSNAALSFGDEGAAKEILSSLSSKSSVLEAVLFNRDGAPFTSWQASGAQGILTLPSSPSNYGKAGLVIRRPVFLDGETIGFVAIRIGYRALWLKILSFGLVAFLVGLAATVVARFAALRLGRPITDPLLGLAAAARKVSGDNDYTVRVPSKGNDEIGLLTEAFNNMLDQIETRDMALVFARSELVENVKALEHEIEGHRATQATLAEREEELRHAQKMEAVGRLAGGVAHDFNNIMTAIQGYAELSLEFGTVDDRMRGNLKEIKSAADRAAGLTRQLLAFSRKQIVEPQILEISRIVGGMESMLRTLLAARTEVQLDFRSPGIVKADAVQIEQVILNLAANAKDAMPNGGRFVVRVEDADTGPLSADSRVLLEVSDTGCGMTAEIREHIFEPFFTTKERGRGTGFGLATVFAIVGQNGGSIDCASKPGEGTTFRILLPRVEGVPIAAAAASSPSEPPAGRETLLLVEDEEPVRTLLQMYLTSLGYRVIEASDGAVALELFRRSPGDIDLVISDLEMPNMGGRALHAELSVEHPGLPFLFMSGYTESETMRDQIRDAAVQFVSKPFSMSVIAQKVRQVLDARTVAVPA